MAEKEHDFERRPVDKQSHHRRISSSLAALSLHQNGDEVARPNGHHQIFSNEELAVKSSEEDLSQRLLNGEDLETGEQSRERWNSVGSGSASFASDATARSRKASISFAKEVTTSDGDREALGKPLPRSGAIGMSHAVPDDEQRDDEQNHDLNGSHTSKSLDRRKHPMLFLGFNGHGEKGARLPDVAAEEQASLTCAVGSPSDLGEPMTPLSGMLSPAAVQTPPAEEDGKPAPIPFWPSQRRTESQRSRSYQRLDKAGLPRRRSTRSANSSMSPAASFLAQWKSQPVQEEEPEPDDQGQEIAGSSWYIGRAIGYGGFSVVKECSTMDSKTGKRVVRAVKIMRKKPKQIRDESQNERVQSEFEHEVALWRFLRHRYIVPLIAVYDTPFATFCITKLNMGGTLHDLVRSRRQQYNAEERGLSAPLAKRYTYQLAAAIRYLHEDVRMVHRDIKLENCLLDMSAPDSATQGGNILLCDFGMADYIRSDSRDSTAQESHNIGPAASSSRLDLSNPVKADLNNRDTTLTVMGSLEYAAPEVVTATTTLFSPKADVWAFGVCVYAMITGGLPFTSDMQEKLALMISKSQWDIAPLFQAPAIRGGGLAGMAAVDLVKGCLTCSAEERMSIGEVLDARWLINCKEIYGDGVLSDEEIGEWTS